MVAEWRPGTNQTVAAYRLEITGTAQVRLDDGQGRQQVLGAKKMPHELYWYGGWMAESVRGEDTQEVVLRRSDSAARSLRITFGAGTVGQVAVHRLHTPPESRVYQAVFGMTIEEDQTIRVESRDDSAQRPPEGGQTAENVPRRAPSAPLQELEEARQSLAGMRAELEAQQRANSKLRELLGARGDDLIAALAQDSAILSEALAGKLEQARAAQEETQGLRARLEETELQIQAAEQEYAGLRRQMEEAEALLEVKTLDCGQTRADLDSLRTQLDCDRDTIVLMEEEPFLKGNSVRKTLENVSKELEAAERRLGRIIVLREKINDAVQQTITRGDGVLPLDSELGGEQDGSDGHEAEDSSATGAD